MGIDGLEIRMGSDLSLDLRYFTTKVMKQARDVQASDVDACICLLEKEQGKIKILKQELPLCTRLLAEVIDVMKAEVGKTMKRDRKTEEEEEDAAGDKSKWMSTARLWTGDFRWEDVESERQDKGRSLPEATSRGDAFLPFKAMGSSVPAFVPPCLRVDNKTSDLGMMDLPLLSSTTINNAPIAANTAMESRRQVVGFAHATATVITMAPSTPSSLSLQSQQQQTPQQQHARKARRTWSPELHCQFVIALNQLGGPQFATPKLIRKLMKVDGLTNDEVKSHLQRYRLHKRRASESAIVSQPIARVGGMWIPGEQNSSHSGSTQCPFHFSSSGLAVSSTSTLSWQEEDGRSDTYDWKW